MASGSRALLRHSSESEVYNRLELKTRLETAGKYEVLLSPYQYVTKDGVSATRRALVYNRVWYLLRGLLSDASSGF